MINRIDMTGWATKRANEAILQQKTDNPIIESVIVDLSISYPVLSEDCSALSTDYSVL